MGTLADLRRNRRLMQLLCAVWILAWLQAALLPCAMAMELPGWAGSDLRPVVQQDMQMDGAGSDTQMPDCVHCPPAADSHDDSFHDDPSHDSSGRHCSYPQSSQVDARGPVQLQADNPGFHAVWMDATWRMATIVFKAGPQTYLAAPPPVSRPFTLTYCVQLK